MTDYQRSYIRQRQDLFLGSVQVDGFENQHGPNCPLWEGGPTISQLRQLIFPEWFERIGQAMEEFADEQTA